MDYEMEEIKHGFERQIGAEFKLNADRDPGTQSADDQLHSGANERGHRQEFNHRQSVESDPAEQRRNHEQHALHLGAAKRTARKRQKQLATGFERWTEADARNKQANGREANRN